MRWPWLKARGSKNKLRLSLRCNGQLIAYVLSDPSLNQNLPCPLLRWGAIPLDAELDFEQAVDKALQSLNLSASEVIALLEPQEYQILKVDTPNVPNEELKAAARWQIKELVEKHLDDLTLDVMHVGGDVPRVQRQLFVVAARSRAVEQRSTHCAAAGLPLQVVDTWETALRNLQTLKAQSEGLQERACAALLMMEDQCLLTISAGGELFYTRRLDQDPRLAARATGQLVVKPQQEAPLGFEYTPGADYLSAQDDSEESVLIIELQRSIDLWERSWPELPLARLYLLSPEHGDAVAALMQRELGLRTMAMGVPQLFSGIDEASLQDPVRLRELEACLPLLGAALRQESRAL
ncbi:hypothetical protein DBR47_20795 [Paucibacter sp. KBW04]|uniref:hypothetical protein n=1 Tax=Paucibacter sp. KBW04 TaxID=2153361 RepID=UPI000F580AF7|nr:hypothetical protein [Paucibacter sp. KBW04]RQO55317.1 hypothetical protein DBR47_20795 [Paucibacter sp. KBW04]